MKNSTSRRLRLLALLAAFSVAATACGEGTAVTDAADEPGRGEAVEVSGSSTVAPISTRVAELFADENSDVTVNVDGPGTGDGFKLFCEGSIDISDASRPIKPEEAEACEEAGIEFIELKVAIDGLSVITSAKNDAIECLNFADLYALAGPESQGIDNWDEAEKLSSELGSDTDLPDAELTVSAPGEESGTYDSFVEIVLEHFTEEREQDAESRPDYQSSSDDNVILQAVTGSESSFGWVGYAYAKEARGVKLVPIAKEPGDECIEPTDETIASGDYPIARDLFIYVNKENAETNEAIVDYVDFFLSDDGIGSVPDVGYVSLKPEALEETRTVWKDRATGTRAG
jgi:phosphate transport system substrate-binding protein